MNRPDYWLGKFSKLRVDRARGDPAPHKPLLLLVLCDLVEQASLSHDTLALTPELAFRFYTYWSIVAGRRPQRPDVRLPFHHLEGDGIWSVLDQQGNPSQLAGREARFRIRVVGAYNFTCALSAYRLTTISAGSIVDAAHIHEFRDSRNNDPHNGIALSKNAHWTFDQGLWTIADDYRIIVAIGHFAEAGPNEDNLLQSYHGRRLNLPEDKTLWPDPIHLVRHRKEKFGAA